MVLFWKNSPNEIYEFLDDVNDENKNVVRAASDQLNIRLYKLVKFDKSGRLYFRHHQEAKTSIGFKRGIRYRLAKTM